MKHDRKFTDQQLDFLINLCSLEQQRLKESISLTEDLLKKMKEKKMGDCKKIFPLKFKNADLRMCKRVLSILDLSNENLQN